MLGASTQTQSEARRFFWRSVWCAIGMGVLFLLLLVRLCYLQLFKHHFYMTLSQRNVISVVPIQPSRGLIYDRYGVLLAKNDPVYSLMLIPGRLKNIKETIQSLTPILHLTPEDIKSFYASMKRYYPYQPVPLKKQITETEADQFYVSQYQFPGAVIQRGEVRDYPLGKALSDVVGYVGRINTAELSKQNPSNYTSSDDIGKAGIEEQDENILHGETGAAEAEIDASGKIVRTLKRTAPTPGSNVYLTIDSALQIAAEKAMGHHAGAIVVIQPSTGQVLALVTKPNYDPNLFTQGMTAKQYQTLLHAKNNPLFNRALRGLYAPGSTVKPFVAFNALNNDIVSTEDYIHDPGWFRLPNTTHVFHDWKKGGHGWVNIYKSIYMSCDTFFYQLASTMGIARLDHAIRAFGFGQKTGIDLPNERAGVVSSPSWKMSHIGHPWYGGDTVMTGIGQSFTLATPLQLAQAVAIIAERGEKFQPNVLMEVVNPDGTEASVQPIVETPLTTKNAEAWNTVISGMIQVIKNSDGTAHWGFGDAPYSAAGKTGTAQLYNDNGARDRSEASLPERLRSNHLFIAFAPVKDPDIAIAVVVEHSPIADRVGRKVFDAYFQEEKARALAAKNNTAPAIPTPVNTAPPLALPEPNDAGAMDSENLQQEMDARLNLQMKLESEGKTDAKDNSQ